MATWNATSTATVKVRKAHSSESFTFPGINGDNTAGSPDKVLSAVNNILDFAGLSAVRSGMTRTLTQGVSE